MPETTFDLLIVSPEKVVFEAPVTKIIVPGITQELAILPHHTPLYAQLLSGNVIIFQSTEKSPQSIPIDGGILRVKLNRASILIGYDINPLNPVRPN